MQKEYLTVFKSNVARQLLREGYTICDIKPDKLDPDHKKTIFVFRNKEGLLERLKELKREDLQDDIVA